jgi:hypothetical protein
MTIEPRYDLNALVATYTRATHAADAHPSPEHAGVSAVLAHIADEARRAIASNLDRYDHRSLYEFAAALDYATKLQRPDP